MIYKIKDIYLKVECEIEQYEELVFLSIIWTM